VTTATEPPSPPSVDRERDPVAPALRGETRRRWVIDVVLALPAALILAGWLIVALVHIDDRFEIGHGQGAWMALARHADVSGLYPELFDGTSYGGTRHMPLSILAHAALSRLTGEYITAGKLLGLFATAGMVVVTFALLRRIGCRWSWALALSALAVGGFAGFRAGTTIGGEPLPVVLGVGALMVAIRSRRHPALIGAAVLTALGVSAKLTAVWAPIAILAWLFVTERRRAAYFAAYAVGATVLLLVAFNLMSNGRMADNLIAVWGAGVHSPLDLVKAPARLLDFLVEGEIAVWSLLPVVAYAGATRRWPIRLAALPLAWLAAAGLLVVVLADIGTGPNQILDLAVLTALCVGALVASANLDDARDRVIIMVLAGIVAWSGITSFVVRVRPPLQDALVTAATASDPYPRNFLEAQLSPDVSVLSEDPGLLIEAGRQPVVLDPFMLRRLADTHPDAVGQLIKRVNEQEFDLVVLIVALRDPSDEWWRDYHFGTEVITAVHQGYELDQRVGGYFLYLPRS
jgi:hypothetical protein